MDVHVHFDDASPVFTCQCGTRHFGDSVIDAFAAWWQHVSIKHPDAFN